MGLENGVKPSLSGFKGVGYNRSLPESFRFANAWLGDGVNDYLTIPEMAGQSFLSIRGSTGHSFEYWGILNHRGNDGLWRINYDDGGIESYAKPASVSHSYTLSGGGFFSTPGQDVPNDTTGGVKQYASLVLHNGVGMSQCYKDGLLYKSFSSFNQTSNPLITVFYIFTQGIGFNSHRSEFTEFRWYKEELSYNDIRIMYNGGVYANPIRTENLLLWFDFAKAEPVEDLYPGGLPSGWVAGDWGIRNKAAQDSWPNKYHAKVFNTTMNSTLGGVIQSW